MRGTTYIFRTCGMAGVLAGALALTVPAVCAAEEGGAAPPPVDTSTNPKALILNARNPLAVHAGPGEPNVGSIYIPPTPSGKEKKAKEGQTQDKVMGAETGEK
ncbi:MAG TPA: hypothetical protein VMH36_05820 [Alphaproteobacteria bacterium]|nr:hypothetical protein [Alphaproteobacteria bacterium]